MRKQIIFKGFHRPLLSIAALNPFRVFDCEGDVYTTSYDIKFDKSCAYDLHDENRRVKMQKAHERDKKRVPLRIDSKTVIYVDPDKCNEAYAKEYVKRHSEIEKNLQKRRY